MIFSVRRSVVSQDMASVELESIAEEHIETVKETSKSEVASSPSLALIAQAQGWSTKVSAPDATPVS